MWRVFARFSSDGLGWELGLRSSGSAPVGKSVQSDAEIDGYSVRRGVSRRGVRRGHHGVQGDQDDAFPCRAADVPRLVRYIFSRLHAEDEFFVASLVRQAGSWSGCRWRRGRPST